MQPNIMYPHVSQVPINTCTVDGDALMSLTTNRACTFVWQLQGGGDWDLLTSRMLTTCQRVRS